ncbi:MAG: thiolase family protein [Proteobacteria bacterium]|nr:thiolase family protein [Pseudomonadota bacterium]
MREVAIIGVGMHRFGKFLDKSLKDLSHEAVWNAIEDANIQLSDIETAYVGCGLAGLITNQEGVRGQVILRHAGFSEIPIVNVEGACASGTIALREAMIAVGAGLYDVALCLGVEKLFCNDTARSAGALATDTDVETMGGLGFTFVAKYAMDMRKCMEKYGWTQEDFAKVSSKNKYNGSLNPYAQYRKPMSVDEILNSRMVAYPLTLYMCSSMADGAAAAIVCAKEIARKFTSKPLVTISACEMRCIHIPDPKEMAAGSIDFGAYEIPAKAAYEKAGVGPEDIDVAEVHDAMSPAEMRSYVACGFCKGEDVPKWLEEERTSLNGALPVNTGGGLAARGHPVGATGLAQIAELTWQLRGEAGHRQVSGKRGEGPNVALAQNGGGFIEGEPAVTMVTILTK